MRACSVGAARARRFLAPVGELLDRHRSWLIPAIIGFATAIAMSYTTANQMQARFFYTEDSAYMHPWRARVLTNWLSGRVISHEQWGGVFFGLIALTYIIAGRRASPFLILATFGVIQATYQFPDGMGMKAWDLPAVWIFAVLYALIAHERLFLVAAVAVLGIVFKETSIVGAIAILFPPALAMRHKILLFSATVLLGVLLRTVIDAAVGNPVFHSFGMMEANATGTFFTQMTRSHFGWNVGWMLLKMPYTPLLLNAGTLVALFILPSTLPKIWTWRAIGLAFIAGEVLIGRINEWRIFLEMTPPAVWFLYMWMCSRSTVAESTRVDPVSASEAQSRSRRSS